MHVQEIKALPLCPDSDQVRLQASDAPEEEPVPLAPARSPFQKPSVQVMSLSDDAFEAGPAQVTPFASSRRPLLSDVSRMVPLSDTWHATLCRMF